MREIKFRAWHKKLNKYIPYSARAKNGDLLQANGSWQKSEDVDWEQFTSLKDKNGKEIYEGDKVRIEWDNGVITISVIIWDDWGFCTNLFAELPDAEQIEIIGNIHQNPELIEKE